MKTINIKGKEYIEVNERLKFFRHSYADYSLETEIISCDGGVCVMKATVKDGGGRTVSTGHAYEKEGSTFINKTSYIENCETSAVGRALGNLGIGIDTSIASAEEVQNAIKNQNKKPSLTLTAQIDRSVTEAASVEVLKEIWNKNQALHSNKEFVNLINERKTELSC